MVCMTFYKRIICYGILLFLCGGIGITIKKMITLQDTGLLKVHMLDVGQGDALLIETSSATRFLLDGGPDNMVLQKIHEVLPLHDTTVHGIIASHNDADHITGIIPLYGLYKDVQTFVASSSQRKKQDDIARSFEQAYAGRKTYFVGRGDRIFLDATTATFIEFLHPTIDYVDDDNNNHSLVFVLVHKSVCMIFTGDVSVKNEREIIEYYTPDFLDCDVLKVGHHGSDTSSDPVFVGTVNPSIALISAGRENKFGHPHQSVLDTLEKVGAEVYRTDELGTVTVVSDGEKVWVEK